MPLRFAEAADEAYAFPLTIQHLLDACTVSAAEQEIVFRDLRRMTYSDLRKRIARLALALRELGVQAGATVAVLDWDSDRYLECYFAVPMMGAVLQTVNVRLSPEQIHFTLDHAGADVLLVHEDFATLAAQLLPRLPAVRATVFMTDSAARAPDGYAGEYEELLARADDTYPFEDFNENALATTFYTTGTTGAPKAIEFTHRQIVLHTLAVATALGTRADGGLRSDDVYMPLTPMFHVHAWGLPYVATLLGLKQVYPGRYDYDAVLDLRLREGVTLSHCVPTVLEMLLTAARGREAGSLSGWFVLVGGSSLTRELFDRAAAEGVQAVAGYGMSETGPVIGVAVGGPRDHASARSGNPVPLTSARVVAEDMTDLPLDDRTQGELVVRAPWLTQSYRGDPAASIQLWRGGWLHTQDLATMDSTGSIQIRDRTKDVIKTGGEWVSSLSLEEIIGAHPDVAEVAVIGVPDPKWQERPVAVIVPKGDRVPTREAVNALLSEAVAAGRLSRYALVDDVIPIAALPRTSVGKIDKKMLRASFAAESPAMSSAGQT